MCGNIVGMATKRSGNPAKKPAVWTEPALPIEEADLDERRGRAVLDVSTWAGKRDDAQKRMDAAVAEARRAGVSWEHLGRLVGLSGEGTRRRYGRS